MKELTTEKMMTVKEIANILCVTDQAIRDAVKKLFPDNIS